MILSFEKILWTLKTPLYKIGSLLDESELLKVLPQSVCRISLDWSENTEPQSWPWEDFFSSWNSHLTFSACGSMPRWPRCHAAYEVQISQRTWTRVYGVRRGKGVWLTLRIKKKVLCWACVFWRTLTGIGQHFLTLLGPFKLRFY